MKIYRTIRIDEETKQIIDSIICKKSKKFNLEECNEKLTKILESEICKNKDLLEYNCLSINVKAYFTIASIIEETFNKLFKNDDYFNIILKYYNNGIESSGSPLESIVPRIHFNKEIYDFSFNFLKDFNLKYKINMKYSDLIKISLIWYIENDINY